MEITPVPEYYSSSHIGKVRTNNQDYLSLNDKENWGILADGVGGQHFGEIASKLAVDSCAYYLSEESDLTKIKNSEKELVNGIKFANEKIITLKQNENKYKNMATTLSCFHLQNNQLHYAFIGDTRIYSISLKLSTVKQLSTDHTLNPDKLNQNLAPSLHKNAKNILTKVVGSFLLLQPDSGTTQVQAGDYILVCTDGLYNHLNNDDFLHCLENSHNNLSLCGEALLNKALDDGGHDNISFILVKL